MLVRPSEDKTILSYQLERSPNSKLTVETVESGCYFHPVATPKGIIITDEAPSDHPHHRGIFLAWVEMHGRKDADFWGWGEHAPTKQRRIVNRGVSDLQGGIGQARFRARNEWSAEGETLLIGSAFVDGRGQRGRLRTDPPPTYSLRLHAAR